MLQLGKVFDKYKSNYENIFEKLYPAKNNTGFTERNLSVNFANAYISLNAGSIVWYEFQFGEKNNLHYDAIIINEKSKEILIIESKRFQNYKKVQSSVYDVERINNIRKLYYEDFNSRIENFNQYCLYGVVLADVWDQSKRETAIRNSVYNSFVNECFIENYNIPIHKPFVYSVINFENATKDSIRNNYHLVSIVWEI